MCAQMHTNMYTNTQQKNTWLCIHKHTSVYMWFSCPPHLEVMKEGWNVDSSFLRVGRDTGKDLKILQRLRGTHDLQYIHGIMYVPYF